MSSVAFLGHQKCTKIVGGWGPHGGSLQRSPTLIAGFKEAYFKDPTSKGRGREGTGREGREGAKMIYAPGRKKPSFRH